LLFGRIYLLFPTRAISTRWRSPPPAAAMAVRSGATAAPIDRDVAEGYASALSGEIAAAKRE
jgi:hypothetical protein